MLTRAFSFANRCVDIWNSLHKHIVNARSFYSFKASVVIKTLHVETEAKTEAEAQSSWSVFLADRTDGRVCATVLRFLSSVCLSCCLSVMLCTVDCTL